VLPILDYADVIYSSTPETNFRPLNTLYNSLCRFVLRCPYSTHNCLMYVSLNWLAPKARRKFHWSLFTFKCIYFNFPHYLKKYLIPFCSQYSLRHTDHLVFYTPRIRKEIGRSTFKFKAPSDWNKLPQSLRSITSFHIFKSSLFTHCQTSCSCFWLDSVCLDLLACCLCLSTLYLDLSTVLYFMPWFCVHHVCMYCIVCKNIYVHVYICTVWWMAGLGGALSVSDCDCISWLISKAMYRIKRRSAEVPFLFTYNSPEWKIRCLTQQTILWKSHNGHVRERHLHLLLPIFCERCWNLHHILGKLSNSTSIFTD